MTHYTSLSMVQYRNLEMYQIVIKLWQLSFVTKEDISHISKYN